MGKPFKKELAILKDTYCWAKSQELGPFKSLIDDLLQKPTFVVGSGGSFSTCHMLSLLHQFRGGFAKPVTPLELYSSANSIRNSNVVVLSASGKNTDILFAYKHAIKNDAAKILGICTKMNTKLSSLASSHSISTILEFDSPAGKDGFLATNSLLAYFVLLSGLYGFKNSVEAFELPTDLMEEISLFVSKLYHDFTLLVLYSGWAQPVAIDIESKFTEAGLGNVLLCDYRNFAHGRHNWLDKKRKQTAIISLVTKEEHLLAKKTLDLIPSDIPRLLLTSEHSTTLCSIDLLIQSFYLVNAIGDKVGIDPGRPGVPTYGSKLYNLKYTGLLKEPKEDYKSINAILRKTGYLSFLDLRDDEKKFWWNKLAEFKSKISNEKFGALILDYDGTLCTKEERAGLPSKEVIDFLNLFIGRNYVLGIVTGRGKSIRETLVKCLNSKFHQNVIIGYYNGAVIAPLTDDTQPPTAKKSKKSLSIIADKLEKFPYPGTRLEITLRPLQLTIEDNGKSDWRITKNRVLEEIKKLGLYDIQVLESGHSLDIVSKPDVSKLNIVKYCKEECEKRKIATAFLCIGDKGRLPGNDFELLSVPNSLSVDEVSTDANTCWNLSEQGSHGVLTSLHYLNQFKFFGNYFTLSL